MTHPFACSSGCKRYFAAVNVGHFPILVIMSVVYFTTVYTLTTPRTPYLIRYAMLLAEVFAISGIHNLGLIDPAPLCFWCFFFGGGFVDVYPKCLALYRPTPGV